MSETRGCLITGGAGYIGSHTVRAMREIGRRVVVLDSLEFSEADSVGDAPLVVGDIGDEALVTEICREHEVDTIVHFAAYKNVGESMRSPRSYFHNNVDKTVTLIDAALGAGVERFVFSSSCSVYGNPERVPVDEAQVIRPESVYAETKAMVERILHWYGQVTALRSVSLRYFNAAGASPDATLGEDWTYALNLIPVAIRALLTDGEQLSVYGDDYDTPDGTCVRDYIHVVDLAAAHIAAVDYLAGGGATTAINLGTGVGSSVFDVLRGIERLAGRAVPHRIVPRREGDPAATYADPTLARQVLGWEARFGLTEILESALRWHERQLVAG
jgi:UDP-glucose-4-epimerase GalE